MLFPKCPKCGGKVEAAPEPALHKPETDAAKFVHDAQHTAGHVGTHYVRHHGSEIAKAHRVLAVAVMAWGLGQLAWERVPGGGEKQCTACQHKFR